MIFRPMRVSGGGASLALILCVQPAAMAQTVDPLATKFGARESVRSISISPEGKQIVVVGPRATGGENAVVMALDNSRKPSAILSSKGNGEQVSYCRFILETRAICGVYFVQGKGRSIEASTRLLTIASDGSDIKQLSAKASSFSFYNTNYGGGLIDRMVPGNPSAVLMTRWIAPEVTTGTIVASPQSGLAVEQVDVVTLARKVIESPKKTAFEYISDGQGNVRLMGMQPTQESGYAKSQIIYRYRPAGGGPWSDLSRITLHAGLSTGFEPYAVDSTQNVAYGFDANGNYTALFKRSLDGSGTATLVLARPDADVDQLIQIGRNQRVIGASYATDKRSVEYFDPELKRLAASLGKALGGSKQVSIIDSSADESKLVIFAGSDTDPGKFYLYDKIKRSLGELLQARPELDGMNFGTMTSIQFPAEDGTMVPGYLTLPYGSNGKNLPAIVMPHGGPSSRDEWGFDWLAQYFVARGYAVLQPNYRGSSGLGVKWFQKNGFQSWRTAVGDVNASGRWLTSQGIAAPGKLAIFGWSYGGYAALQSAIIDPDLFKAIVAVAPVTDLDALREESREDQNFPQIDNFIGHGPHVESGSPARHAASFKAPVLLFHGDADRNVGVQESREMKGKLSAAGKSVEYVEFPKLDHQLDDPAARTKLLSGSDQFIRRALGM